MYNKETSVNLLAGFLEQAVGIVQAVSKLEECTNAYLEQEKAFFEKNKEFQTVQRALFSVDLWDENYTKEQRAAVIIEAGEVVGLDKNHPLVSEFGKAMAGVKSVEAAIQTAVDLLMDAPK